MNFNQIKYGRFKVFVNGVFSGGPFSGTFISTWRTTGASETVTLPYVSNGIYRGFIDWGDGTVTRNTFGDRVHTYEVAGDYEITISGYMFGWAFNNTGDRLKIRSIQQWGCFNHGNLVGAFRGCSNLTALNVVDVLNTKGITNLDRFFENCTSIALVNKLNDWDISSVTILARMFLRCSLFNQDLDSWDTSNVTTIQQTFFNCTVFNGKIGTWNLLKCTVLNAVQSCPAFNQDISAWRFPLATNINSMFAGCDSFNQDISSWEVGNIQNFDNMFTSADSFNQNIGSWDVSSATTMNGMFNDAFQFNQNIGNWSVGNVTSMTSMFRNAVSFDQNIGNWNVEKVGSFTGFMIFKTPLTFSTVNLDAIYNGWTNVLLKPSLLITFGAAKRTAASTEARALLTRTSTVRTITNAIDNGSGAIRITAASHGLTTGNKVFIYDVLGAVEANGAWDVTVVDPNTIDLIGSTFINTYTSGGSMRTGYGWTITDGGI